MEFKKLIYKCFNRPKIKIYGRNNDVKISSSAITRHLNISIYGENNTIYIDDDVKIHNTRIIVGFFNAPVKDCVIKIGKETTINSMLIQVGENGSTINIGENCLFSFLVELNCTDHHSIFDENNELINRGNFIEIGDRVWVCKEVRVMKNSSVASGSILAQRALVTKQFSEPNCIIAGNPAKVVKRNIHWDRKRPNLFI